METASSQLSTLPVTKKELEVFSSKIMDELDNGTVNPLMLKKFFKSLEMVEDAVKDKLREYMVSEASKYGEKEFDFMGATYALGEYGTKYDYKSTNDPFWAEYDTLKRDREAFLRSLKEPIKIINEETSEEITVYPPKKTSTTSVSVTIK